MSIKLKTVDEIRDVSPDEDTDIIAQRIYDWMISNCIESVKLDLLVKKNFHNNFVHYANDKERVKAAIGKLVRLGVLDPPRFRGGGHYLVVPPSENRRKTIDFI